jgi:hypothetical protein
MRSGFALAATLAALSITAHADGLDSERGRGLYEQRCDGCHGISVHARGRKVANDYADIRALVERWSTHLDLRWGPEEIEDVTMFLNDKYYHYAMPAKGARRPEPRVVSDSAAPR